MASCDILLDAHGGKHRLKITWSNLSFKYYQYQHQKPMLNFQKFTNFFSNAVKHPAFLETALARDPCLESTSVTRGELDSTVNSLILTPE